MWEQEPGSPMMGRQLGQSGQALSPHRNHLREEMLLNIRAWGGQLRGMWAKIQDAKSLCPAKADISPSRPQRAGVEQPSLHSAEWTVPQRAGVGSGWEHARLIPGWGVAPTLQSPPPPPSLEQSPRVESVTPQPRLPMRGVWAAVSPRRQQQGLQQGRGRPTRPAHQSQSVTYFVYNLQAKDRFYIFK